MKSNYEPPFLGRKILKNIQISDLLPFLNKAALFRISWGALKAKGEKWQRIQEEFKQQLDKMLVQLQQESWIQPQSSYGHWFASSKDNTIILFDPVKVNQNVAEFPLPRQKFGEKLCLADYIHSIENNELDVVSLQIVTSGSRASKYIQNLFKSENYVEAYFAHGLAVQFAEATAGYVHQKIREDLDLNKNQGRRYSWGYDPIPNLSQHQIAFDLLQAKEKLGMGLTSAFQIIPEQSTAALVIHNKNAKYFRIENS